MKKTSILLFLTLGYFLASGQEYLLLKGQTRDSLLSTIPFANVMVLDTATQEMEGFAVSDVNGNFQIRLKKDTPYELQVTYVGFVPYKKMIQLEETNAEPYVIVLKESVSNLDEVTVVAEMPVLVQGDTISYKAEAFMDGDERKLEDVLEDLPGFNINDNGDIEVQGKRVEKVLVDGKEFFEGDSKLATKNIPADVIERVQVLQNFNDIAPMQGIGNDDRLALNIELKEDKKRIVFGDIEVGGGPEERYFGHANTFYYAPKTSINFIGDANNIGELALSLNDYFRMTGGLSSMASRNGTTYRINAADAGIPVTDRNSARALKSQLGALNVAASPSNKIQLSGFAIGFNNDDLLGSNSLRTYPQLGAITQEQLVTGTNIENTSGLARLSAKYTPNYNLQLDYSYFGKRGNILQMQDRFSTQNVETNQLDETINRTPSSERHQLRLFNAFNEKNIIAAELSLEKDENLTNRNLFSDLSLFSGFLTLSTSVLTQDQSVSTTNMNGSLNYYYILNKTTHLNAAFGVNRSNQKLRSMLEDENAVIQTLDEQLRINNQFARFSFRKKWNQLTIDPGVSMNQYQLDRNVEGTERYQFLFPQITTTYDFGSSHSLQSSYRQSLEFSDIANYTEGLLLYGYNTFLSGNQGLQPAIYHTFNLNYRNFNTYNFFNIYGGINYQYIKDGFTQNQELQGIEGVIKTINSPSPNRIANAYANLEKRFNNWRIGGNATFGKTELTNQFEGEDLINRNFTQQYGLNLSAKLFKKWSVRAGYRLSMNEYTSGSISNTFRNHQPTTSTTFIYKGFRLDLSYEYNQYESKNQGVSSSFDVLDASLSYRKKKSPWEFKVQGLNLLNTSEVRRDSFTNNLISTYGYFIQPRYSILTVKYDL